MRTKSYDTLEKEAIAESLGISLNKYRYIERRIAESDNPNDTVENWVKEGKIRLRKTKEEVKEEEKEKEEKVKKNDTEDKKDKEADTDSDTNTESNNETKDSIVNDDVEIKDIKIKEIETKEEKASKSTLSKSTSTINTNKHICDRCHSKIKDSEYNLNLSYLINGLAGYRFKIDSSRVKLCHNCAIELGKVVEEWLIDNGNGVRVKPWMGDDGKEDKEEDREVDGFDDFNF